MGLQTTSGAAKILPINILAGYPFVMATTSFWIPNVKYRTPFAAYFVQREIMNLKAKLGRICLDNVWIISYHTLFYKLFSFFFRHHNLVVFRWCVATFLVEMRLKWRVILWMSLHFTNATKISVSVFLFVMCRIQHHRSSVYICCSLIPFCHV